MKCDINFAFVARCQLRSRSKPEEVFDPVTKQLSMEGLHKVFSLFAVCELRGF
jgi:hypothetical protein